jgi:hypothetical protein
MRDGCIHQTRTSDRHDMLESGLQQLGVRVLSGDGGLGVTS